MIINTTATTNTEIRDLGIIISTGETIDLLINFNKEDLLKSADLQSAMNTLTTSIDGVIVDYDELIKRIKSLTNHEHYNLNQLQHNIYENNFFKVTKLNGTTKYITYYSDETMTEKIQEDEIIRDIDGKVERIITRKYDNEIIVQELTQLLNRVGGKVESITTNAQ